MGPESIAHEAEGRMGIDSEAMRERAIITSWSKIWRIKKF